MLAGVAVEVAVAVPPVIVPCAGLVAVEVAPAVLVVVAGSGVAPEPGEGVGAAAALPEAAGLRSITL